MNNKLYVGNLSYSTNDADLSELFSESGEVVSAKVIMDRESGRSKGFGFVEMSNADEAEQAISSFNGFEFQGRSLRVNVAKPQEKRERGFRSNRKRY
ncbi:RNA-binding protein [uncultured Lentibacter sp.]|uniref:RNA recognition motif domain-containing protein n=1 Tax=uncultured Lentibacter sp. TaxID=1659309 RepID=UPI00261C93B6|nr:RNA-binding protein [uncultured Lentibacter sp.]